MKNQVKKILYLDMDGVLADFDHAIKQHCPELETSDIFPDYESREAKVNAICESNPDIFHNLITIPGAINAVKRLDEIYDIYFLSTPMENVPLSYAGKRVWLEKHFGKIAYKKLILTHRKDLAIGHYLVDDRTRNGAGEFTGEHIHFGSPRYINWDTTLFYLESVVHHVKPVQWRKIE